MKRLMMMLIMVLVMVMEVVASDVVVFNTMDSQDAFVRFFNIGTTNNVIVVENKEMFNNIALPTFASAQVSDNVIAIVNSDDEFATYAVKFSKEEKVTYLYVATEVTITTTSTEVTVTPVVPTLTTTSIINSLELVTSLVINTVIDLTATVTFAASTLSFDNIGTIASVNSLIDTDMFSTVVLFVTMILTLIGLAVNVKSVDKNLITVTTIKTEVVEYQIPKIELNLIEKIDFVSIKNIWVHPDMIELRLYDVYTNDDDHSVYVYGLENKSFKCINLNTGKRFLKNKHDLVHIYSIVSKDYKPYAAGDVIKSLKDDNVFFIICDNGDHYHCFDVKTSKFFKLSRNIVLDNIKIIDNKSLEDLFQYFYSLKCAIKKGGQYICDDGFIIVANINVFEVIYEKYDFNWNLQSLSSADIFNFENLVKPIKHEKDVVGLIKKNGKYLSFFHNKIGEYSLPIGTIENGEDPQTSLKREMFEELGIRIVKFKFVEKRTFKIFENLYSVCYFYYIEKYNGKINNKEPNKHSKLDYRNHLDEVRYSIQTEYVIKN